MAVMALLFSYNIFREIFRKFIHVKVTRTRIEQYSVAYLYSRDTHATHTRARARVI